ncbi:hypothetical protein M0R45_019763 [Rubus argutus]|uniref:SWIM-type domain-containing protein n=1 Tax=Rubus argutus TaxID=59490 RepID=A0AAW1X6C5_RUBAR
MLKLMRKTSSSCSCYCSSTSSSRRGTPCLHSTSLTLVVPINNYVSFFHSQSLNPKQVPVPIPIPIPIPIPCETLEAQSHYS